MPIDFAQLKSAEPVSLEDLPEIVGRRASELQAAGKLAAANHSRVVRDADDRPIVVKAGSTRAAKAIMPAPDELARLAGLRGIDWPEGMAERAFEWWASDERVDRHGDIVRQNWNFGDFAKNPVMLWGHDWNGLPMGSVLTERVVQRSESDYTGPALALVGVFALGWEWAETLFRLVKGGILRTGSVGFFPGDVVRITDPDERAALGLGEWGLLYGVTVPNDLIEWTIASVPANIGAHLTALRTMKAAGALEFRDIQALRELARSSTRRGVGDKAAWAQRDALILETWKTVFPGQPVPEHVELDAPVLLQELAEETKRRQISKPAPVSKTAKEAEPEPEPKPAGKTDVEPEESSPTGGDQEEPESIKSLSASVEALHRKVDMLLTDGATVRTTVEDVRTLIEEGSTSHTSPAKNHAGGEDWAELLAASKRVATMVEEKSKR